MDKLCSMCKLNLPFARFYKDRSKKDGYKVYCKSCDTSFARRKDIEFLRERINRNHSRNRLEMNDSYWKRIARRHKVDAALLKSIYIDQHKKCFYCKVDLLAANLHVDHYYPKSSIKIVISCADCNRLKWQKNGDEFLVFIKTYINRFS